MNNNTATQNKRYSKGVSNTLSLLDKAVQLRKTASADNIADDDTKNVTPSSTNSVSGDNNTTTSNLPGDGVGVEATSVATKDPEQEKKIRADAQRFQNDIAVAVGGTDSMNIAEAIEPKQTSDEGGMKSANSNVNVAEGIDIQNTQLLAKVATYMLATEEGRANASNLIDAGYIDPSEVQQLKFAAEEAFQAEQQEVMLKMAHEQLSQLSPDQQDMMLKTAANHSYNLEKFASDPRLQACYLEGVKFAQAAMANAPMPEADIASNEQSLMELVGMAIEGMVNSQELTPEQAQQLFAIISEQAMADGNEELSQDELMMGLQNAIANGLITPEMLQSLQGGQSAPMPTSAPAVDPAMMGGAMPPQGVDPAMMGGAAPATAPMPTEDPNAGLVGKVASAIGTVIADEGDLEGDETSLESLIAENPEVLDSVVSEEEPVGDITSESLPENEMSTEEIAQALQSIISEDEVDDEQSEVDNEALIQALAEAPEEKIDELLNIISTDAE